MAINTETASRAAAAPAGVKDGTAPPVCGGGGDQHGNGFPGGRSTGGSTGRKANYLLCGRRRSGRGGTCATAGAQRGGRNAPGGAPGLRPGVSRGCAAPG